MLLLLWFAQVAAVNAVVMVEASRRLPMSRLLFSSDRLSVVRQERMHLQSGRIFFPAHDVFGVPGRTIGK